MPCRAQGSPTPHGLSSQHRQTRITSVSPVDSLSRPIPVRRQQVHYRQQSMDTAAFHVEIVQGASGFKPFA